MCALLCICSSKRGLHEIKLIRCTAIVAEHFAKDSSYELLWTLPVQTKYFNILSAVEISCVY